LFYNIRSRSLYPDDVVRDVRSAGRIHPGPEERVQVRTGDHYFRLFSMILAYFRRFRLFSAEIIDVFLENQYYDQI
jgi:hypothetical protein